MHQPGRYRTPLLLVLTLLLVFTVLSLSLKSSPALRKVQGLVVSMTAPGLEGLCTWAAAPNNSGWAISI